MSKKWKKLEGLDALREAFGSESEESQIAPDEAKKKKNALREPQSAKKDGMVYSTDPNYSKNASQETQDTSEILGNKEQDLRVQLEKKNRGGKAVTLVTGFVGNDEQMNSLGKMLKTKCGVGGAVKDGEIIVQGDHRKKVMEILEKEGYRAKRIN